MIFLLLLLLTLLTLTLAIKASGLPFIKANLFIKGIKKNNKKIVSLLDTKKKYIKNRSGSDYGRSEII